MNKICHIVESFGGGVFDFLVELVNGMPKVEHTIIYSNREELDGSFPSMFPDSTKFILWNGAVREINIRHDLAALTFLIKNLKQNAFFDIIHLHSSKAGFLGRAAARILGQHRKVIYTPHGAAFLRQDVSKYRKKVFACLEKIGNSFGGRVVACSRSEANSFLKLGIQANYVNNGICCQSIHQSSNNVACDKEAIRIGTIGRITFQKNPTLFSDMMHSIQNRHLVEAVWIGDGEMKDQLDTRIEVTGWINRKEVIERLKSVDIYVSTSLWEGLPLAVLLAMCAKKPLLLSNCVGNRDLVVNGYNGFLFNGLCEGVDKLSDMIKDLKYLQEMGLNSFNYVKNEFSLKQMVRGYNNIYNSTYAETRLY